MLKNIYLLLSLFPASAPAFPQDIQVPDQMIERTYSKYKVENIIRYIASDELEGRDTPSEGLNRAANYIDSLFRVSGLQALPGMDGFFQAVSMASRFQPDELIISLDEKIISSAGNTFLLSGNITGVVDAEIIMLEGPELPRNRTDLKGKVLVYQVPDGADLSPRQIVQQSRTIVESARQAHAAGFLEVFSRDHSSWDRLKGYFGRTRIELAGGEPEDESLFHVVMHDQDGILSTSGPAGFPDSMSFKVTGSTRKDFITYNVAGMVEGTDPVLKEEVIICGAHYDHVGIGRPDATGDSIYNGARDNAIGVMSVLMAAENLGRYPARRSILFVLFTGEEKGLLGSQWFVAHSPVPLDQIVFCMNSDGGGYNDTTIATVMGLRRLETRQVFKDGCEAYGLSAFGGLDETQFLFNNSDNVVFSRKGIPSVTFSAGFREFDAQLLQYYHQPSDEAGTLDFGYLFDFSRSFGSSLRRIADLDGRLFWKEGDEYYEIGKELYGE